MSGVVLELLSWRWLFVLALVPVAVAIALVPRLPESRELAPGRPDWLGGLLLSIALLALLVGLTEGKDWGWTSTAVLGLFTGGIAVLAIWVAIERRVEYPMVDLDVFARPPIALLSACTFLIGYAMFAVYTILPGFVAADPAEAGHGFSASPIEIGVFLLPVAVAMLVSGPPAGGARQVAPINVLRLGIVAAVCWGSSRPPTTTAGCVACGSAFWGSARGSLSRCSGGWRWRRCARIRPV